MNKSIWHMSVRLYRNGILQKVKLFDEISDGANIHKDFVDKKELKQVIKHAMSIKEGKKIMDL